MNLCSQRSFYVYCPATPDSPVANDTLKRRVRPQSLITDIYVVKVGVEHDRRGDSLAVDSAYHIADLVAIALIKPETRQLDLDKVCYIFFFARQTGSLDQLLQEFYTGFKIVHGNLVERKGASDLLLLLKMEIFQRRGDRRSRGSNGGYCLLHLLLQDAFENLSHGALGKLIYKLDLARNLELRQLISAKLHDFCFGQHRTLFDHNVGLDNFFADRTGFTDDSCLNNLRMLVQNLLNFPRVNVHPGADDDVLLSVDYPEEAFLVADRHVSSK